MVRGSLGLAQGHRHPPVSQVGTLTWAGCSTAGTHMSLGARAGVPMEGSQGPQGKPDVPPWYPPSLHPPMTSPALGCHPIHGHMSLAQEPHFGSAPAHNPSPCGTSCTHADNDACHSLVGHLGVTECLDVEGTDTQCGGGQAWESHSQQAQCQHHGPHPAGSDAEPQGCSDGSQT